VVGVAYKPDVEDVRESPAVDIVMDLRRGGAVVAYHDPLIPTVRLSDATELASVDDPRGWDADIVVVHTLHQLLELQWLEDASLVLDTTYRLRDLPRRFAL
jgi:UDP-N-acetyl-D-mannosaminuronate dehydrogenase